MTDNKQEVVDPDPWSIFDVGFEDGSVEPDPLADFHPPYTTENDVAQYLLDNVPFYHTLEQLQNGHTENGLDYQSIYTDDMDMKAAESFVRNDPYVKMLKERKAVIDALNADERVNNFYPYAFDRSAIITGYTEGKMVRRPLYREGMTIDDMKKDSELNKYLDTIYDEGQAINYLARHVPFYHIEDYVINGHPDENGHYYKPLYFPGITLKDAKNIVNGTYTPESNEYIATLKERAAVLEYLETDPFYKRVPYSADMTIDKLEGRKVKLPILYTIPLYRNIPDAHKYNNVVHGFTTEGVYYPPLYRDELTPMDCRIIACIRGGIGDAKKCLSFKNFLQKYIDVDNNYELSENIQFLLNLYKAEKFNAMRFRDLDEKHNMSFKADLIQALRKGLRSQVEGKEGVDRKVSEDLQEIVKKYFPKTRHNEKLEIYRWMLGLKFDMLSFGALDSLPYDMIQLMIKRSPRTPTNTPLKGGLYMLNKKMYGGLI